ncbi:hypothetical protein CPB85DRAFT_753842 [Mucidula mucida]|nr:hypothetical protein CPB85DRAFT_753842 [Mucidula mucida]
MGASSLRKHLLIQLEQRRPAHNPIQHRRQIPLLRFTTRSPRPIFTHSRLLWPTSIVRAHLGMGMGTTCSPVSAGAWRWRTSSTLRKRSTPSSLHCWDAGGPGEESLSYKGPFGVSGHHRFLQDFNSLSEHEIEVLCNKPVHELTKDQGWLSLALGLERIC